jgi:hypothetical protein
MVNNKKFNDYCEELGFSVVDIKKILRLVMLNDGKVNALMIRGHFPISWSTSMRIAKEMSSCGLAVLEDKPSSAINRLPSKDISGLWKKGL